MYICPEHNREGTTNGTIRCCNKMRWIGLGLSHSRPAPHGIHPVVWLKTHNLWPFR